MEEGPKLKVTVKQLMNSRKAAGPAPHHPEYPHARLKAFSSTKDLGPLYFVRSRSTLKFENMNPEKRVTLLVDNRSNSEEDFDSSRVING